MSPLARLSVEAFGRGEPDGNAVTNVEAVTSVAVTTMTTALAVGGTWAPTSRSIVCPAPTVPWFPPVDVRVSSARRGGLGVNPAPVVPGR